MAPSETNGDARPSKHRREGVPEKMKALQYGRPTSLFGLKLTSRRYSGPEKFAVVEIDVPTIGDDDVLVQQALTSSSLPLT